MFFINFHSKSRSYICEYFQNKGEICIYLIKMVDYFLFALCFVMTVEFQQNLSLWPHCLNRNQVSLKTDAARSLQIPAAFTSTLKSDT